jgi:hypothetical protein
MVYALKVLIIFFLCINLQSPKAEADFERQIRDFNRNEFTQRLRDLESEVRTAKIEIQDAAEQKKIEEQGVQYFEESVPSSEISSDSDIVFNTSYDYGYEQKYVSNFFGERIDVEPENTQIHTGNMQAILAIEKWIYRFSMQSKYKQHQEFTENDRFEHVWRQEIALETNRFDISVTDTAGYKGLDADLDGKISRVFTNSINGNITWRGSDKTKWILRVNNSQSNYLNDIRKDNNNLKNSISFGARHKISPKTIFSSKYIRNWARPKKGLKVNDIEGHGIEAKLIYNPSRKLGLAADGGLSFRKFNRPDIHTIGTKIGWNTSIALNYDLTPKTELFLGLRRGASPEGLIASPDDPINVAISSSLNYAFSSKISGDLGLSNTFITQRLITSTVDPETPSITNTRKDTGSITNLSLGLEFKSLRNLIFGLDYNYSLGIYDNKVSNSKNHSLSTYFNYLF